MGRRLDRWAALPWGDRFQLIGCAIGLPLVHAGLALLGYARTRQLIERLTQSHAPQRAGEEDLGAARKLAQFAAIAGRHGAVDATCLRQSLLVHGWLRRRGLQPVLQLGIHEQARPSAGPFVAHAWVELEGTPLLPIDAGHRPFVNRPTRPDAS